MLLVVEVECCLGSRIQVNGLFHTPPLQQLLQLIRELLQGCNTTGRSVYIEQWVKMRISVSLARTPIAVRSPF